MGGCEAVESCVPIQIDRVLNTRQYLALNLFNDTKVYMTIQPAQRLTTPALCCRYEYFLNDILGLCPPFLLVLLLFALHTAPCPTGAATTTTTVDSIDLALRTLHFLHHLLEKVITYTATTQGRRM